MSSLIPLYALAVVACYAGAAGSRRYRGPLITLGVVLTIPAVVFTAWIVLVFISLSNGAHIG